MLVETELKDPSPITLPPPTRMKHFSMEEVCSCDLDGTIDLHFLRTVAAQPMRRR
jgi:hypothetical protein